MKEARVSLKRCGGLRTTAKGVGVCILVCLLMRYKLLVFSFQGISSELFANLTELREKVTNMEYASNN